MILGNIAKENMVHREYDGETDWNIKFVKCNVLRKYLEDKMLSKLKKTTVTLTGYHGDCASKYKAAIVEFLKINPISEKEYYHDPKIRNRSIYGTKSNYDQSQLLQRYKINNHSRIQALNGQYGVKAMLNIGRCTCLGEYYGRYLFLGDQEECSTEDRG